MSPALLLAASEGGSGPPAFLSELVAFLLAAAAIGYLSTRLRVVPIVGFLLAGVLIGPNQLGLVSDGEVVDAAAEIGVILLLFTIGIEFSLERLARIARLILVGGGLQVVMTTALTVGLARLVGATWQEALFTGFLVSLSSTAIVLKLLASRGETGSRSGQVSLAFLIFQDLAVVLMVLLVPLLGNSGSEGGPWALVQALGTAVVVVAFVLVAARRLLPPVLEVVARACSPEVFLLAVVALCFGTAYLTSLAGVSVALGAFLAGLVVSESRHSEHAFGEVLPLQILFSATFFLSVGMLLDLGFLVSNLPLVILAVLAVVVVKAVVAALAARLVGEPWAPAVAAGLLLAQIGEFSFVLESVGREAGLTPAGLGEDGSQAFIAATVVLMCATPATGALGRLLGARLGARASRGGKVTGEPEAPDEPLGEGGVAVLGLGAAGRDLARRLHGVGIPVVATTLNPDFAAQMEREGIEVVRGDPTRSTTLEAAGVARARVVVVPDDDPSTTERVATAARRAAPRAVVVVRPVGDADVAELADAGVDKVVSSERQAFGALRDVVVSTWRALGREDADLPRHRATSSASRSAGHVEDGRTVVDTSRLVVSHLRASTACPHADQVRTVLPASRGCEECQAVGEDAWVHLRLCLGCGHVGCCDSSPHRHARVHADAEEHPVMASAEPGEGWAFCFLDGTTMEPADEGEQVARATRGQEQARS